MGSPALQPSSTSVPNPITAPSSRQSTPRVRSYTTTVDAHGAVCKRGSSRSRTLSGPHADRLYRLAAEQQQQHQHQHQQQLHHSPEAQHNNLGSIQWLTPQHSPVPSAISADPSCEPFPAWTVPTPPRSDSGFPTVSLDANDDPIVTTALCTSAEFHDYEPPTASAEMSSSLGYLLPSQYGPSLYESEPNSYPMDQYNMPPLRVSQPSATSGPAAYAQSITSSPVPYQSSMARRPDVPTSQPPFARVGGSPYDSPASNYAVAPGQSIPPISGLTHGALPSPPMSSSGTPMMPQYSATSMPRSPALYDQSVYGPAFTSAPSGPQMYAPMPAMGYPPQYVGNNVADIMAKPMGPDGSIRALSARPKPQCWDHGCNGRQFSTFSNLLRHQREKSGTANKAYCPKCGAEFTRTTARNGHLAHDKCTKNRRSTDSK